MQGAIETEGGSSCSRQPLSDTIYMRYFISELIRVESNVPIKFDSKASVYTSEADVTHFFLPIVNKQTKTNHRCQSNKQTTLNGTEENQAKNGISIFPQTGGKIYLPEPVNV